ncbi:MAG TPA: indolepyruvate oxidoreductase subunit beta [Spirochaetia bacterium]|nr:indolepyruvate oxidoreductase subunit beta [Spirochaetia bacterium]
MTDVGVHNIIVTGVGGQGNVLASQVIATAAVESGFLVSVGETFGASQRGGSVMSHVRVSREEAYGPLIPRSRASVIIGFEPLETLRTLAVYGGSDTAVIMNRRPNYPLGVLLGDFTYPDVDRITEVIRANSRSLTVLEATELAVAAGLPVGTNMVMTGAFAGSGVLPIAAETYEAVLGGLFSGEMLASNLKAFRAGLGTVAAPGEARN